MNIKKISLMVIAILFVMTAVFFFLERSSKYVVYVSGRPVSVSEYRLYLYEQKKSFESAAQGTNIWKADFDGISAESVAKQNALDSVELIKISNIEAEKRGLILNEEDLKNAAILKKQLTDKIGKDVLDSIGLSEKEFQKIMLENQFYLKLYGQLTENVAIRENEFRDYFELYLVEHPEASKAVEVEWLFLSANAEENGIKRDQNPEEQQKTSEKLLQIRALVQSGVPIDKLMEQFSLQDQSNAIPINIEDTPLPEAVKEVAYAMEEGACSVGIETPGGYYLVKTTTVQQKDMAVLEVALREEYTEIQKQAFFDGEYKKWRQNTDIRMNKNVWDQIHIEDFS